MSIYVLIKTYPKDDYLGALCYESWMNVGIKPFMFLADEGSYEHIIRCNIPIKYHPSFSGYNGQQGVRGMMKAMKVGKEFHDNDIVILCDSDVVVKKSFLHELVDFDHAGTGGVTPVSYGELGHISGQMQIFSGWFFNDLNELSDEKIDIWINNIINIGLSLSDDTFLSHLSDMYGYKKKYINLYSEYWIHHKYFEYEGTPVKEALKQILQA